MTWTQGEIEHLIGEYEEDLLAYKMAYDSLIHRMSVVEGTLQETRFSKTSGCQAAVHVLIMNIASTEGILEDLRTNLEWMRDAKAGKKKDG